jgi:TatD DNase family protein
MLIDTHCHLDFDRFDGDRDAVVERALAAGVERIIIPALDQHNWTAVIHLTERYEPVYAAVGVHPNSTAGWQDEWIEHLRDLAQHQKVVAIGEIGLDYYWEKSPLEKQHKALSHQLALAAELDLPVIIHNRDAGEDVLKLLRNSPLAGKEGAGVLHSFSADWETAQIAVALGFYIGITGPVTFKKAEKLRYIAVNLPLNKLVVETDAPFLTPHPFRGKRNEPAFVTYVAERIAQERGIKITDLAKQTTSNAIRLFWKAEYGNHNG